MKVVISVLKLLFAVNSYSLYYKQGTSRFHALLAPSSLLIYMARHIYLAPGLGSTRSIVLSLKDDYPPPLGGGSGGKELNSFLLLVHRSHLRSIFHPHPPMTEVHGPPCSLELVWLIIHGWKYYWLIWCERKILFIGWKSMAYKPNKPKWTGYSRGRLYPPLAWRGWDWPSNMVSVIVWSCKYENTWLALQ